MSSSNVLTPSICHLILVHNTATVADRVRVGVGLTSLTASGGATTLSNQLMAASGGVHSPRTPITSCSKT